MPRPGTTITRSETRPSRSAQTSTGPGLIVGPTGTADTDALGVRKPVTSLAEYAARFGSRASHVNDGGGGAQALFDFAEFYFKDGGAELFVSPAVFHATPATYEVNIATALALLTRDLGPGQVAHPGRSTPATHLALANHALANNRIAILDGPDTVNVATLTAAAAIAGIAPEAERYASLWAPWVTVPGVNGIGTRTIPPSAIVMALMAYNDGRGVTPNQPSAGDTYGESEFALGVTQAYVESDSNTLNLNGVNLLRTMYGGVRVYGYRTLADPATDDNWVNLANARLFMAIQAEADAVAERYVFKQIDGQRKLINEFGGALTGVLLPYWQRGSLFGTVPEEAFRVDVGPNVNTKDTIAAKSLKANIAVITSEFAEEVILEIVKTRIKETL